MRGLAKWLAFLAALVRAKEAETGRAIGLYPEIKHPTYFIGQGHDLARMLVEELHEAGYRGEDAKVFIQCFEVGPLVRLDDMTAIPLVQLVAADFGPADQPGRLAAEAYPDFAVQPGKRGWTVARSGSAG